MTCRSWHHYSKSLEGVGVEYGDCPIRCENSNRAKIKRYDIARSDFCKVCPRKTKLDAFKRATENRWLEWFTEQQMRGLKFDAIFDVLKSVFAVRDLTADEMSVKTSVLVGIFEQEEARYKRKHQANI